MLKSWTFYLELAARYYVFLILNVYGWGKILGGQFFRPGHFPAEAARLPLAEASGFNLAWAFFGHSPFYIWFIGLSQIVGAWLLLSPKTKLPGVAILIPILLNIVVVDITFQISFGAMAVAATCLALLLLVLFLNLPTLKAIFAILWQPAVSEKPVLKARMKTMAIIFGFLAVIFGFQSLVIWLANL
ncbi:hypothetical protein GCM10028803_01500 [Larkinella knui]|uniref:DoxX family membrane protein n=1 Tax=Larkinella knui TaxID=2025310 RepID=A0A3P1CLH3_9BACT|nr:hypothetical protein [Larkinella knui]RRB14145.1 hypothetical protein EHT87_18065 [Larkinella knui]